MPPGVVRAVADAGGADVDRHDRRDQRVAQLLATSIAVRARHDRVAGENVLRAARFGAAVDDEDVDHAGLLLFDDLGMRQQLELDDILDRFSELRERWRRRPGRRTRPGPQASSYDPQKGFHTERTRKPQNREERILPGSADGPRRQTETGTVPYRPRRPSWRQPRSGTPRSDVRRPLRRDLSSAIDASPARRPA